MKIVAILSLSLLALGLNACHSPFPLNAKLPGADYLARKTSITISTTAKSVAELPVCNASAVGVGGFIASSDTVLKCDGARWRAVNPGGFDGRFVSRDTIRFHEWQDLKNKKIWSSPSESLLAFDVAAKSCPKGWKLPTATELRTASENGLVDGLRAHGGRAFANAWTADPERKIAAALTFSSQDPDTSAKVAGVYCVTSRPDSNRL